MKTKNRRIVIEMEALEAQVGFMDSTSFHTAYIGGYGSGKTFVCAMKALVMAVTNKELPGMILAPTERMAEEVTGRAFREILEKHNIPHNYMASSKKIGSPWGGEVYLRSAHQPRPAQRLQPGLGGVGRGGPDERGGLPGGPVQGKTPGGPDAAAVSDHHAGGLQLGLPPLCGKPSPGLPDILVRHQ